MMFSQGKTPYLFTLSKKPLKLWIITITWDIVFSYNAKCYVEQGYIRFAKKKTFFTSWCSVQTNLVKPLMMYSSELCGGGKCDITEKYNLDFVNIFWLLITKCGIWKIKNHTSRYE